MDTEELEARLERVRQALRDLDLGKLAGKIKATREHRSERQAARKALIREVRRKEERFDQLIEDGANPESDRMLALAKDIRKLRDRIHELHEIATELGERIVRFVGFYDRKAERRELLERRLRELTERIEEIESEPQTGTGPWAGTQSIIEQEVVPIMLQHGPITSRKRWETYGNPSSDHYMGNETAYAADCGTADNYALAQQIRTQLDGGRHVEYESFYFQRAGRTYRGQLIAGTHGTGPHCHAGVRLT